MRITCVKQVSATACARYLGQSITDGVISWKIECGHEQVFVAKPPQTLILYTASTVLIKGSANGLDQLEVQVCHGVSAAGTIATGDKWPPAPELPSKTCLEDPDPRTAHIFSYGTSTTM